MYDNVLACQLHAREGAAPFTEFSRVDCNTNLQELNLNWREQDLPERERTKHVHRLHPYMGKFIPQLAEIFLRKFDPRLVYDPFCGSGTTLVEAKSLGIESVGTDISAFNALLTQVKVAEYDIMELEREADVAISYIEQSNETPTQLRLDSHLPKSILEEWETDNEYLTKWFSKRALRHLLHYKASTENFHYSDLFKIVLSRSARSARLVTHFDLDFPKRPQTLPYDCYKHSRTCYPVDEANKFLRRYTIDAVKRVREFQSTRQAGKANVIHGDSKTIDLPFGINMVFTSPPYVGLIDYHEQHRYAYELLGLPNNEHKEIGPAKKGLSVKAKQAYIDDINQVFEHTRSFMAPKGILVIVVNDKHNLYDPAQSGFKQVDRIERHVNRRTGRRASAFYESILIWERI